MEKVKKKIWKVLLMIPVVLLFNCSLPVSAAEMDSPANITSEVEAEAADQKATPGDAWFSSITGVADTSQKTLDDIYLVCFWILLILAVYVIFKAFVFIFNCLS